MRNFLKSLFASKADSPEKYLNHQEVKMILRTQLDTRLTKNHLLILSDANYTVIDSQEVVNIYDKSDIKLHKFMEEKHDCDDFSLLMKAEVVKAARKNKHIEYAYAFGLIYGSFPHPHAINWYITPDKKLMLLEPQTGEIFSVKGKNIVFIFS